MQVLKGLPVAKKLFAEARARIEAKNLAPKLTVIILGNDPAAMFYVQNIEKKGASIGVDVTIMREDDSISQDQLLSIIHGLNEDPNVHGIMVQKPLPKQIDDMTVSIAIAPEKDVDAFHPMNLGNLLLDREGFIPCTPAAVMDMIRHYEIPVSGKHVVVLGRSDIVGKPMALLLLRKRDFANATVTVCHSRTQNLAEITRSADVLIAAIGVARFVKADMIKEGAVVIDVGVNEISDGQGGTMYTGDVDYDDLCEKTTMITPVPKGVGTVTTARLISNVVEAAFRNRE